MNTRLVCEQCRCWGLLEEALEYNTIKLQMTNDEKMKLHHIEWSYFT